MIQRGHLFLSPPLVLISRSTPTQFPTHCVSSAIYARASEPITPNAVRPITPNTVRPFTLRVFGAIYATIGSKLRSRQRANYTVPSFRIFIRGKTIKSIAATIPIPAPGDIKSARNPMRGPNIIVNNDLS